MTYAESSRVREQDRYTGHRFLGRRFEAMRSAAISHAACYVLALMLSFACAGQSPPLSDAAHPAQNSVDAQPSAQAQTELQAGTDLTRQGLLQQAIPHLLAVQAAGAAPYASGVNLAICYQGLGRYKEAVATLNALRASGLATAVVENLLAQAYIGDGQMKAALDAFQRAASLTPTDEKLYAFVADACTDHHAYEMGLRAVEVGLQQLPQSARLHYERALFLARLDRLEEAKPEFDRAAQIAPGTYIADLALVQKRLYAGDYKDGANLLREAVKAGHRDAQVLSLLGTVLLQAGAVPGDPEFAEAKSALEESATDRPADSSTQIALGKIYSMQGRYSDAVEHLEAGRRLEPDNRSVYAALAHAYRKLGDVERARLMDAQLAKIIAEEKQNATAPPR